DRRRLAGLRATPQLRDPVAVRSHSPPYARFRASPQRLLPDHHQPAPDWRAALRLTGGQRVALPPRLLPLSVRAAATTAFAGVSTSRNLRLLSEQHSEQHP